MSQVEFGLLGPVTVRRDGHEVDLRSTQQRCLLVLLLTNVGQVVPVDRMVDVLWRDDEMPRTARNIVQVSISGLRRALGPDVRLVHQARGYRLDVDPACIDLTRFRTLVTRARGVRDRVTPLRTALELWRGEPLADVPGLEPVKHALAEERLAAVEDRLAAELHAGASHDLVPELIRLTAEHPLRERLRDQLMLALYRAGRAGEAMNVFHEFRRTLDEQLGTEPGPALRRRYEQILHADQELEVAQPVPETADRPRHRGSVLAAAFVLSAVFLITTAWLPGAEDSAAARYGWGTPVRAAEFTSGPDGGWTVAGPRPGRDGKGWQRPGQVTFADGIATITGLPNGDTGYLAQSSGTRHGRWEARVRIPEGCTCYRPVLTLWPDANDAGAGGGEVVYLEVFDARRQAAHFYLGHGPNRESATRAADLTRWTHVAVEWTAEHVSGYLNGERWFHSTDPAKLPPRAMHPTIKLDYVPHGAATESQLQVDWIRKYRS